jgi:hypothetical protein
MYIAVTINIYGDGSLDSLKMIKIKVGKPE